MSIASLNPEFTTEVWDLILKPPHDNLYDTLKSQLIRCTAASEQQKLQQLINSEELGDHKPTQLLRQMQQLLGDKLGSADLQSFLRELFLHASPEQRTHGSGLGRHLHGPGQIDGHGRQVNGGGHTYHRLDCRLHPPTSLVPSHGCNGWLQPWPLRDTASMRVAHLASLVRLHNCLHYWECAFILLPTCKINVLEIILLHFISHRHCWVQVMHSTLTWILMKELAYLLVMKCRYVYTSMVLYAWSYKNMIIIFNPFFFFSGTVRWPLKSMPGVWYTLARLATLPGISRQSHGTGRSMRLIQLIRQVVRWGAIWIVLVSIFMLIHVTLVGVKYPARNSTTLVRQGAWYPPRFT